MAIAAATVAHTDLQRPAHSVMSSVRQMLATANHVSTPAWGVPLTELARRLPSAVYGGVLQTLACYVPPATFTRCDGPKVLLVPGLFCQPSVLNQLGHELERLGCDVYLPRSFPYFHGVLANSARVEQSVRVLLNDLETLTVKHNIEEITLVGHSLGGIISLATAAKAKTSHRALPHIRGVVLLATPLHGSPLAAPLKALVPACRDLDANSAVLREIRATVGANCRMVSSGADSVVPLDSQEAIAAEVTRLDGFQHTDFYIGDKVRIARAAHAIAEAVMARELLPTARS